jgi:hypothetical protein
VGCLADGLGDGDGLGLGEGLCGAAASGVSALGVVALGVVVMGPLPGIVALGVALAETVGVAGLVPPGEKLGGVVGGAPPEQADTDAVASIAMVTQPRTVRRKRRRP